MRHAAAIRSRPRSTFALGSLVLLLVVTPVASAAPRDVGRQSGPRVDVSLNPAPAPHDRLAKPHGPHPAFGNPFSRLQIRVTAVADSSIAVAWGGLRGHVLGYIVFKDGVPVGVTSDERYTFTGLSCETSYVLGVVAFRAHWRSPVAAAAIDARTAACPPPPPDTAPPSTPGNVHITATSADPPAF